MRRALLVALAALAVWLTACAFLFVWPAEDEVGRADAVVVLAGDAAHRIPRGLELVERGVAGQLVLSREPGPKWDRWRPLCGEPSVLCFTAEPYSTTGEAETLAGLAERLGWRSIALVTSRYHLFRARMIFRRCLAAGVAAVGTGYDRRWLPAILPLETAKLVRDAVSGPAC